MTSEGAYRPPQAGEVIAGKYRIQRILGEGGMGCVVAARHLYLNQDVAIKFLQPAGAGDPQYTARFLREAQAAATIKSEHVVRVVDMGALDNGAPYMVMEYLDGKDLGQLVDAQGPLPVADAVDYVLQASEALAEAHAAGLVHRDIKPPNLFLARRTDGSPLVKLLDFGIAKSQNPVNGSLTATGASMGSPSYMSPEQVRSSKDVDARSDIWAMGATLYELLTGRPPFEAETFSALCAAIMVDAPAPLRKLRPDAPAALEKVILRCLEKDPNKRFADVAAFAQALAPFASPTAQISIERIGNLLSPHPRDGASSPRISLTSGAAASASPFAQTAAATSTTIGARTNESGRSGLRLALPIGVALILGIAGVAFFAMRGERAPEPPGSLASAPERTQTTTMPSAPEPRVLLAPTASAEPVSSASASALPASASKPPSTTARPRLPSSSPPSQKTKPSHVDPFADQH